MTEGTVTSIQSAKNFSVSQEQKHEFVGAYLSQDDEELGRFRELLTISEAVDMFGFFIFVDSHIFLSPMSPSGFSMEIVSEYTKGLYVECHEPAVLDIVASRLRAIKNESECY